MISFNQPRAALQTGSKLKIRRVNTTVFNKSSMRKSFFYSVLTILLLSLTNCKKEESNLIGRIKYKGAVTGIEYAAANTQVQLYLGSPSGEPYATVNTDAEGYYQFSGLWEAHWYIASQITVNGFTYTGTTGTTEVEGNNVVTLNLLME